ncbi:MAG: branched-chain amino acid transport system substrate-binding protein [Solirubrobacteraceae bacterium]|nr:branched-chain amino acid transport system substrate-binding protein [Solirubrobacteraceae bacterium]
MQIRTRAAIGCLLPALALGLTACGGSDNKSSTSSGGSSAGGTVGVYSSLPLQGASKDQTGAMVQGIKLALEQAGGKAGNVTVKYTSLDDSTAQAGNWDPQQTASNARKVAQDKSAVAYIGEFNSGASAISIPILNQIGIAQISPANTYVGLTTSEPGSEKGEPQKYQPSGKKTYTRIVPRDTIQAAALITQTKTDGCTKVAIANDKETYGAGLGRLLEIKAKALGQTITSDTGIQKDSPNFRAYASKVKSEGADCFIFSGVTANGAVQIYKDVSAAIPSAKLYGPDGDCESGFTNPSKKGIPASIGAKFKCTVATLDLNSYPGGKKFIADFKAKYGTGNPDPYAIYGYEAMQLVLDTIKAAGSNGTSRDGFLTQLFKTKDRSSVLGTYSIDANGDTTLTDYGLYKVGPDGNPTYESTIKASSGA